VRYRRRPPIALLLGFVPLAAAIWWTIDAGTDAYLDDPTMLVVAPLAGAFCITAAFWVFGLVDNRRRMREWRALAEWGAPHGLAFDLLGYSASSTLGRRDDVAIENVISGVIAGAREGSLAHVAIPRRRWRFLAAIPLMAIFAYGSFDLWTVVRLRLNADEVRPFRRLHLRRGGLRDASLLAAFSDVATPLRHVELESVELHDLYGLEVDDDADDVAVRRLFSPVFIRWLIERAERPLMVDVHGGELVVAVPGRHLAPAELDDALATAVTVAENVAPAIRDEVPPPRQSVTPLVPRSHVIWIAFSGVALLASFGVGGYFVLRGTDSISRPSEAREEARGLAVSARIPQDRVLQYRATVVGVGDLLGSGTLTVASSSRRRLVHLDLTTASVWQRWDGTTIEWTCRASLGGSPTCAAGGDAVLEPVVALLDGATLGEHFDLDGFATTNTSGAATCASLLGGTFCVRPDGIVTEVRANRDGVVTLDLTEERALEEGDLAAPAKIG
jgi:hypothetical protein